MDTTGWVITGVIIAAAVLIIAAVAWTVMTGRRRSRELQGVFGSEYDRTVGTMGRRGKAEEELERRRERVEMLNIQPLSREDKERFAMEWQGIQARFVDDPAGAVEEADVLITDVMQKQGYPVGDFEQRTADLSVEHASALRDYREAHSLALAQRRGEASTDDLRNAMIHYRALFNDLLGKPGTGRRAA